MAEYKPRRPYFPPKSFLEHGACFAYVVKQCTLSRNSAIKSQMAGKDNRCISNVFEMPVQDYRAISLAFCPYFRMVVFHLYKILPLYSIHPYMGLLSLKRL